jgi:hypothetical protein
MNLAISPGEDKRIMPTIRLRVATLAADVKPPMHYGPEELGIICGPELCLIS